MAYIQSSTITWQIPDANGRIDVRETHVDDLGHPYIIDYVADPGTDLQAHLAASAANLVAFLTQSRIGNEIGTNVNLVIAAGSVAQPTFLYSTLQENAQALIGTYNNSSGVAAIMIGDYLNSQTDATLIAGSGLSQSEIDSFRAVWTQNAATAAAIRSAAAP